MSTVHDQNETWTTLIRGAMAGRPEDRSNFCHRYLPIVRASLAARWRETAWIDFVEDAVQEVFVECLRDRGLLDSYEPGRRGGFRAFLFGAVRNVALRFERDNGRRHARQSGADTVVGSRPADEDGCSTIFDRAWAQSLVEQAAERMRELAPAKGARGRQRVELLRLRFQEDMPIRDIAAAWEADPAAVHREYRKARQEFHDCLRRVVAMHTQADDQDLDRECARLMELLD